MTYTIPLVHPLYFPLACSPFSAFMSPYFLLPALQSCVHVILSYYNGPLHIPIEFVQSEKPAPPPL